jgi:hypothetical protein
MKTFSQYLTENKKIYSFKVKVAGEIPETFQESLKGRLERCKVMTFEKMSTTPIQKFPLDFPDKSNMEVTVFEVVTEYPVTPPEIALMVSASGIKEGCFRVRGSSEPTEVDQLLMDNEPTGEALLDEQDLDKSTGKIKHKDYFGDDFNKSFLKDLNKAAKDRKKDGINVEYKLPKGKQDKAGAKSALGS